MAFTSNCDIFVSVNEAGINRVVRHVMCQRPSLFNYGTDGVIRNLELLCAPIQAAPAVFQRNNPLLTREPPAPIFGTNPPLGLDFVLQLTQAEVDFSPGTIQLPAELNPPLPQQRIALHVQACAGLGCPSDDIIQRFQLSRFQRNTRKLSAFAGVRNIDLGDGVLTTGTGTVSGQDQEPILLPSAQLNCFCLDLYGIAHLGFFGPAGEPRVFVGIDGLDIVEIKPDGLENSLLCYARLVLQLGILSGGIALPDIAGMIQGLPINSVLPAPTSAALPNNPAVEEDQFKLFINVDATVPPPSVVPCVPDGGGDGGGSPERSIGWGAGPATPPGPDHLIAAISARLIKLMFAVVRNSFHPCFTPSGTFGPFTARLRAGGHLENGTVILNNNNSISVTDLALKWDTLRLDLDVDIPEICVGGFCIIPIPFDGCAVRAPRICIFSDNPDFTITLDLSGLVTSRVTATLRPVIQYGIETTRPAGMTDLDAEDAGIPNEWGVFLDPLFLHIEFIDLPDFVATLLTKAVDAAVDGLLGFLPGWARDLIKAILGGAINIIRTILGIPGDIVDWLSQLIGVDLNLFDLVTTALAQLLAKDKALFMLEDPLPILPAQITPVSLIPVKIPLRDLAVQINADEMALRGKVGAP